MRERLSSQVTAPKATGRYVGRSPLGRALPGALAASLLAASISILPACSGELVASDDAACEQATAALSDCTLAGGEEAECEALALAASEVCTSDVRYAAGSPIDAFIEGLQRWLARQGEACYEAEDVVCLKAVYQALVAGAAAKGYRTAAGNLSNFLWCQQDPQIVSKETLLADSNFQTYLGDLEGRIKGTVRQQRASGSSSGSEDLGSELCTAGGADLYYAMGTFSVRATYSWSSSQGSLGPVVVVQGKVAVYDRYDWHPGLTADGDEVGIGEFQDAWAAWLVEQEAACEFDVQGEVPFTWTWTMP